MFCNVYIKTITSELHYFFASASQEGWGTLYSVSNFQGRFILFSVYQTNKASVKSMIATLSMTRNMTCMFVIVTAHTSFLWRENILYFCEKYLVIFDVSQPVYCVYFFVDVFTDYIYPCYIVLVQYVTILCYFSLNV